MSNVIKHSNIIFMPHISPLGGIETYVYELVKKYKDLDIAVVSRQIDGNQARRIKKYCKVYLYTDQKIECDVAIINYDTSIIDNISANAKIYQTIHADYTSPIYNGKKPSDNSRLTGFIAITDFLKDKMKDLLKSDKVIMSYNPLTIEENKPFLTLVSATRLHENKGPKRVLELAKALDRAGIDFIWYILTCDTNVISHPNIIFIPNRLDTYKWLNIADYVVLLSDSEACSYTLNEALYRNIPIISTPLPYLEEIGVKDGVNSYLVKFDCSNVDEVAKKMKNIPKFKFKQLEDKYGELFTNKKSHYKEDLEKLISVESIDNFSLNAFNDIFNLKRKNIYNDKDGEIYIGDTFDCDSILADYLLGNNKDHTVVVKIIK